MPSKSRLRVRKRTASRELALAVARLFVCYVDKAVFASMSALVSDLKNQMVINDLLGI